MSKIIQNIYLKLYRTIFSSSNEISPEAIIWAYRLFLDREPENSHAITGKLKNLVSTQALRSEFINSAEFKNKNSNFHFLSLSGSEPQMYIESVDDYHELFSHIQNVWENLGETEPYWSVMTSEKYTSTKIKDTRNDFYKTGVGEVTKLFNTLNRNNIDHTSLRTCMEYGCGLGRVTCALAVKFTTVIGYDISEPHLVLAREYMQEQGIQNVSFVHVKTPDEIIDFPKVDLVYSTIVLQHNPPPLICVIIQELLRALNPGGIAFFQVPTYRLGYGFSLQEYMLHEVTKSEMEMHVLPQKEIFEIINNEQCKLIEVIEDGYTGLRFGERSNTFVIQRV